MRQRKTAVSFALTALLCTFAPQITLTNRTTMKKSSIMSGAIALLSLVFAPTFFASCGSSDKSPLEQQEDAPYIIASAQNIEVGKNEQHITQSLLTNIKQQDSTQFEVSSSAEWCVASLSSSPLILNITVKKNETNAERKAVVTVKSKSHDASASVNVTQRADGGVF